MVEIASHTLEDGHHPIRLVGGPWDGKVVGIRDQLALQVLVNGPRAGDHSVWVVHLYERSRDRYEFVRTEVTPLSAWNSWCSRENDR